MNINGFKHPSALFRPAPFWSWNDKLDTKELKRQIHEMADKGWGGYFMHSRVGLVTGYMSKEWMEMVRTCAEEAGKTGMYAWIYDEDQWPSGFAGGEVPGMDEAYRARALVLLTEQESSGSDTVLFETVKNGQKYSICKRVSQLGNPIFNGTCYVDLMNPEAVKAFIDCTHERYKEACGEYFGREIAGIFTDEPCYFLEGYREGSYQCPALPWSEYLPPFFRKLKGYDIEQHLEQLFFDEGDYRKVRFDFFDSASRLFTESFTKQYYQWCCENNMKMTGHFPKEDYLSVQTQSVGAVMPNYQFMHWPGIDKLGKFLEVITTVKQLTSVADQLEKERSVSEVFGGIGQQVSFYHRKWVADWQAVLGINFVNHHLSLYSMRGERKRDYPANFFYQQPWWEDEKSFSDYLSRLSYAVSTGKRKVDILVMHPVASVWCEYSPLHKADGLMVEKNIYESSFEELSKELIGNKLDFHYGDEIIMEEHARVKDGKLFIGAHAYSTIIVPPSCTLRENTVNLLEAFVKEAGKDRLIFLKTYPDRVEGKKASLPLPDKASKKESVGQVISSLDAFYRDRIRITDNYTGKNAGKIICHERETDNGRLFFIANTDEKRKVQATIDIPGSGPLLILDMTTGEYYKAPASYKDGDITMEAAFYPAGSILLFETRESGLYLPAPEILDSGVEFKKHVGARHIIDDWDVLPLDENVLPLNDAVLYMDGTRVLDNQPVAKAWHSHFYKAPDGTPFKAEYYFNVDEIPHMNLFAVIECAENLESITLNGNRLKPLKSRGETGEFNGEKSWLDINFTKVPLNGFVKKGENVLILGGKKVNNITVPCSHCRVEDFKSHHATEFEAVYIVGDFKVMDIDREDFSITFDKYKPCPQDLTSNGYPFYAGRAKFTKEFQIGKAAEGGKHNPVLLKLTHVEAASVKLYVNGKAAGVKYWAPYIFDITNIVQEGTNIVEVIASTTLFNLMGPNRHAGIKEARGVSPYTFIQENEFTAKYELFPFGIGAAVIL